MVERVLEHREAGLPLKRQAVLMRAAHHSDLLEVELARRNIPFVKYGGLKFLEAAHVKDLLCVLRWAENPRDPVAAFRVLQLLPGVGPACARRAADALAAAPCDFAALAAAHVPAGGAQRTGRRCATLLRELRGAARWQGQLGRVRALVRAAPRAALRSRAGAVGDLEQLERSRRTTRRASAFSPS